MTHPGPGVHLSVCRDRARDLCLTGLAPYSRTSLLTVVGVSCIGVMQSLPKNLFSMRMPWYGDQTSIKQGHFIQGWYEFEWYPSHGETTPCVWVRAGRIASLVAVPGRPYLHYIEPYHQNKYQLPHWDADFYYIYLNNYLV
jgi:hypothetical protein